MQTIDRTKPVWRVRGTLPYPDGRRMTVFCNADNFEEAERKGRGEGIAHLESCQHIPPEKIAEWETQFDEMTRAPD